MQRNEDHLEEKFTLAYQKYCNSEGKIFPFFYKSEKDEEHRLYYVWGFGDSTEFDIIRADTILSGGFDPQEETIPAEYDMIHFSLGEFWGGEGDHDQLESILDQILRNKPRDYKFVHINFLNPETDYSNGRSDYIISIEDAIDAQKPFNKKEFDQMFERSRQIHEDERKKYPIAAHFEDKYDHHIEKHSDVYATAWRTLVHCDDNVEEAVKKLEEQLWHWENNPEYTVDHDRSNMLRRIIEEVRTYEKEK